MFPAIVYVLEVLLIINNLLTIKFNIPLLMFIPDIS